jgi:hypothetical protein
MKVELSKVLKAEAQGGVEVAVDVSKIKMNKAQKVAFAKLQAAGNPSKMGVADLNVLKTLKATIQGQKVRPEGLVRFDWTWVSID